MVRYGLSIFKGSVFLIEFLSPLFLPSSSPCSAPHAYTPPVSSQHTNIRAFFFSILIYLGQIAYFKGRMLLLFRIHIWHWIVQEKCYELVCRWLVHF